MSKQSLNKAFKLLEFIRTNTDRDHPATQDCLRKLLGEQNKEIMGDKGTYARRLKDLADAYNTDVDGALLPEEDRRVIYPGYGKAEGSGRKNGKVYYNHPVSAEELSFLIRSIRDTHNLTSDEKESLERRVRNALGSRHFAGPEEYEGCIVRNLDARVDMQRVEENIRRIRSYIKRKLMTDITVLETDEDGKETETKYQVSPYRIVYKDSYYWLIANWHERPADTYTAPFGGKYERYDRFFPWYSDCLTAYRIDLIKEVADAYMPSETVIHWTMNLISMSPPRGKKKTFTRDNVHSLRRARNRVDMMSIVKRFDEAAPGLTFEHGEDISLGR